MKFCQPQDKVNEAATIALLRNIFGPDIHPTSGDFDTFDAYGHDKAGQRCVFEIKRRNYSKHRFDTFVLSKVKFDLLRAFDGDAFYVAVWNDGTLYANVKEMPELRPKMGGREPRPGAVNDIELMVEMPRTFFKEIVC